MIKHKFKLDINIQIGSQVEFGSISKKYRNIEMAENSEGDIELNVIKRETSPIDVSVNEALFEVNEFIDRLSLIDNHKISSFDYLGYENEIGDWFPKKRNLVLKAEATAIILDAQRYYEHPERKQLLNKKSNLGALRIYRLSLGIEDKITQYIMFYGILLILNNESQKQVDEYIIKTISDVLIVDGKHREETIITKVRNMIAHPSNGVDFSELNQQVNHYVETVRILALELLRG